MDRHQFAPARQFITQLVTPDLAIFPDQGDARSEVLIQKDALQFQGQGGFGQLFRNDLGDRKLRGTEQGAVTDGEGIVDNRFVRLRRACRFSLLRHLAA